MHDENYDDYVQHHRYGKHPQVTGENPQDDFLNGVNLHWHAQPNCTIPNTAVKADSSLQIDAMFPISHYYDLKRTCHDCARKFIFFAQEQKHWYETLQFSINANCVRCVECRKEKQFVANRRAQYELLLDAENRSEPDTLTLVDCCLTLIEISAIGSRSIETARRLLNSIAEDSPLREHAAFKDLKLRADKLLKASQETVE